MELISNAFQKSLNEMLPRFNMVPLHITEEEFSEQEPEFVLSILIGICSEISTNIVVCLDFSFLQKLTNITLEDVETKLAEREVRLTISNFAYELVARTYEQLKSQMTVQIADPLIIKGGNVLLRMSRIKGYWILFKANEQTHETYFTIKEPLEK